MHGNWITKKLQSAGYKLTNPRHAISNFLQNVEGIFCAQNIIDALPRIDRVSTYRTLDILEQMGAISQITKINGQLYYEKHDETGHHHHVVCTICKKTKCVDCTTKIPTIKGFSNINHSLIVTGVCNSCN